MSCPASPAIVRPRAKRLWHAVVFLDLPEPQSAAALTACSTGCPATDWWSRLCLSAQRFTSLVSIEAPNALLLELRGSVQLFGSLALLRSAIAAEWQRLGLRTQQATAPTPLAALWLARAGQAACIEDHDLLAGALAPLPIDCTAWNPEWLQRLRAMGVTRVGEVQRLPRAGVARRLSPAAIVDLDIALARQAAPRRSFVPRERFRARCDFESEIDTVAYLQKALEPLTARCARFLQERQAGIQALQLTLRHRELPATRVRVGLASITGARRRLADVLNGKLTRLALAAPVRGMELLSGALLPLSADSLDAFTGLRGGLADTAPQLVERLRARLGEQAVYGVRTVPEHRPEAAWQRVLDLCLTSGSRGVVGPADLSRPVWLLDAPAPLASSLEPLLQQGLILEQGPERIESGWWDGRGVARDYYVARHVRGARWWIFQERRTQGWYLHGVFA